MRVFEKEGIEPVGGDTVREVDPVTRKAVRVGVEKELVRTSSYNICLADAPIYVEPKLRSVSLA